MRIRFSYRRWAIVGEFKMVCNQPYNGLSALFEYECFNERFCCLNVWFGDLVHVGAGF